MKRILSICLTVMLLLTAIPVAAMAISQYGTVTGGWLRLRSAPSFDASTVSSYYTGTSVLVTGTSGSWYAVTAPDGKTGYMYSSYITFSGGSTGTAYVTSSNGLGVRLRSGPSTGYRTLGIFSVGTSLTVLESGTYWSRISIGGLTGYMMNKFITTSGGGGGSGYTATIWSENGYGVRLRSGPGTGYSVIGVYSVGSTVTVLSHGSTWDYISVGSRTGYMMNYYLHTTGQGVASAITLTAPVSSAAQGSTVVLTPNVTGTNLSSPAYTLAVTQNASMASLSGTNLTILGTATVGSVIQVTATTVDNSSTGVKLTAVCSLTVTASTGIVTAFSFDKTTATATVTSSGGSLDVVPTIQGTNLTLPLFTLAVNTEAASYVTATRDSTTGKILININSIIPDGTVFTVTGTTLNPTASGTVLTATITVTVSKTGTLSSITLTPQSTSINSGDYTLVDVRLNYSNGSYVTNPSASMYTLTSSSGYGTISDGNKLTGANTGTTDQTVTITGVATANTSITNTCTVTVKGLSKPGAPTLTTVKAENAQVKATWSTPSNTGGSAITKYRVYYNTSSTFSTTNYKEIAVGTNTLTVDSLTNGTTYYFWVTAFNAQGESAVSNSLSATPSLSVPDAPTSLTVVSIGSGTVNLSWTAPYDGGSTIDSYNVYYGTTHSVVTTNAASITGLTNGTTYSFYVTAHNVNGESSPSSTVTATPSVTSSASVTMVAPVAGATPQTATDVEAATAQTYFTVTGLTWNQAMTAGGKFKAGETYSASVTLTSKGRPFQTTSFTPTVSGAASVGTTTTTGTDIGNTVNFTVTFSATAALTVASIAVTTQPTKMSYTETTDGTLALNGMVVTQTYNDGTTDTVTFTDGTASGYTASPANGATLTAAQSGTTVTVTHTATSQTAQTAALTVAAAPTYIITLDPATDHIFADTTPYTVTVTSTGTAASGDLVVGLSGTNPTFFSPDPASILSIASGDSRTFTVTPLTGSMVSGTTYTATVMVSGASVTTKSFAVSYTMP